MMVVMYAKTIHQLAKKISVHYSMKDIKRLIDLLQVEINIKETNNNKLLFRKGK
jgi:hypothetical protein